MTLPLYPIQYETLIRTALAEDLGMAGDLTTDACVPHDATAKALFNARHEGVCAGLDAALYAFTLLDPTLSITRHVKDGDRIAPGTTLATVEGLARPILSGERTALNLLGRLCGIASETRRLADRIVGTGAQIVCTRKTTPGLRALEKYAVRVGGGGNHRFALDDAVLIKDNHLVAAGGLRAAVERARMRAGHMVKIEVEVDDLDQLAELIDLKVDAVLLDNMDPATLRRAVEMVAGRMVTEASGGVTPETIRAIAETGVTLISLGWLTHSVKNFDIGLDFAVE
ncbi:carboxylating nicotinate-nucleotide diphosphorylase [Niveispirillum cyanobacteriorum]|uniref:Probable nicotinate-nucleotide pyrophosphorylase [carboxylating] n=1 Tax=Niveispirillum cyanobacteriorum TaxID=1612173 RepID=A0A2K9NCU1_9PROT|nr:carboxylating nicotinate-nucleotide diphosphorylase [Niveispirillum cyanobacteriorum]AUN30961.1 nicotinate-nucleotide diphosphorylase (carboxylating) [Niveispirillum cyanobacteriorum]GGE81128.1 nicotinate-nucleotide diphosphorylase (carboxylating) [Niveispirillum cyanobacteriorum]